MDGGLVFSGLGRGVREVAIIGAGRVGRALGRLARVAGWDIGPVVCRSRSRAEEAVAFIGAGRAGTVLEGSRLTLICVPDGAIREVAAGLKVPEGGVVAHTCACLGAEVLRPHRPAGAMHPLRSFGDPASAADRFRGTACAVEGDPAAEEVLEDFVRDVGGRTLRIRPGGKALYHAGAVFASNYVVAILEAALRLFEEAGVGRPEALPVLRLLAEGTLENTARAGLPGALTGPIERGDVDTVRAHVKALAAQAPELARVYGVLGRLTVEVARSKGSIGAEAAGRILEILGEIGSPGGPEARGP